MATSATDKEQTSCIERGEAASEASALLREAQLLAVRVEALLEDALPRSPESSAYRVRLARAHALGLLDQLSDLLTATHDSLSPGLRGCSTRHPESGLQARYLRDEADGPGSMLKEASDDVASGFRSR